MSPHTSFTFAHYITHVPLDITHISRDTSLASDITCHHIIHHIPPHHSSSHMTSLTSTSPGEEKKNITHILRQTSLASDITCYHRVTTSFITCHHVIHLHTLHRSHPTSHHPHPTSHFTTSDITSHITHGTQLDSLERSGPRQRLQAPLKTSIAHRKFT